MIALFQDVFPVPMRYPSEMIIRDGLPRARKRAVMVELVSKHDSRETDVQPREEASSPNPEWNQDQKSR
jgi:hypothetical protein